MMQVEIPQTGNAAPERRSGRGYWWCQVVGWILYGCTYMFFELMYHSEKDTVLDVLWFNGLATIFSMLLGIFLTGHWRRYMRAKGLVRLGSISALLRLAVGICALAILQFALVFIFFFAIHPTAMDELLEWLKNGLAGVLIGWISIYLVWTILYIAFVSRREATTMEIEKLRLELHLKDVELRALQAQVNPHFFFNSLNSIRALLFQDAHVAADVIDRLAGMMRYTLQSGRSNTVSLAEEMEAVRNYLAIEKIRFEERLQLSESVEPGLDGMAFPPMALQTLVENAVKYGVERSAVPCEVRISVKRQGEHMQLMVSNQGHFVESDGGSTKVGVQNTSKRLALLFGAQTAVDLFERDGWVNARLTLPCRSLAA
jgi:two-component sensor histidine kinase